MLMTKARIAGVIAATVMFAGHAPLNAQATERGSLHLFDQSGEPAWTSPENPTGAKGAGGAENRGGKGHAFETIPAGGSHVLADIAGARIIDRMWMTIDDRSPERLRSLVLEIYWDGAATPAVAVPLGDFFLHGAGEMKPFETELLSSAEGRSFVSYIPMPFRAGARIVVRNQSDKQLSLIFFDINHRRLNTQPSKAMYFHAWWTRDRATTLGDAHDILPRITGHGRFVGTSVTVLTNPAYEKSWWGEGEVRIALDGDRNLPSLVGTGAEDYIGTAWGQGAFINRFQGAPVSDEATGRWTFYRFHVPDPIFFARDIKVELQVQGPSTFLTHFGGREGISFGVGLLPLGWARLFGTDAAPIAQTTAPLTDHMDAADCDALMAALRTAKDFTERVAAANAFFSVRLARRPERREHARIAAIHQALSDPAIGTVAQWAAAVGLADHTLGRATRRWMGFSPKLLLRRQRFMRMLGAMHARPYAEWTDFIDPFYTDQSHMIHEFQNFLGIAPTRYFALPRPILRAATRIRTEILGGPAQILHAPRADPGAVSS